MTDLRTLPDPAAPDFDRALARWRKAAGLTQAQLAPLLGVALSTLQKWESGAKHPAGTGHSARSGLQKIQALRAPAAVAEEKV